MSKLSQFFGGLGSGGGALPTRVVSSDETVESNLNVGIDTSGGTVTVTLPADPEPGDRLLFFDAALTWDESSAILNKNGQPLGDNNPELSEVLLEVRGGIIELLYINLVKGWVDVSFYKTGVSPAWFGAFIGNKPLHRIVGDDTPPRISNITSSTDWVVPQTGYYGVNIIGATGTSDAGSSVFRVDGVNLITARGAREGSQRETPPQETDSGAILSVPFGVYSVLTFIDIAGISEVKSVPEGVEFSDSVNELSVFGIDLFQIKGPGYTVTYTDYFGYHTESKAFILFLEEGSQVTVTIGAAGSRGKNGRCEIYDLMGFIV